MNLLLEREEQSKQIEEYLYTIKPYDKNALAMLYEEIRITVYNFAT